MKIRQTTLADQKKTLSVHKAAFGKEEGPEIAKLVYDLYKDPSAFPLYSFVACENDSFIGHILFTKVEVMDSPVPVTASILAPLAVKPDYHSQGIGNALIRTGIEALTNAGVDLVFVLGHPEFYPRAGFKPAGVLGFSAPHTIPEENAGAWMVMELKPGIIKAAKGSVKCCDVLDQPQYWRE